MTHLSVFQLTFGVGIYAGIYLSQNYQVCVPSYWLYNQNRYVHVDVYMPLCVSWRNNKRVLSTPLHSNVRHTHTKKRNHPGENIKNLCVRVWLTCVSSRYRPEYRTPTERLWRFKKKKKDDGITFVSVWWLRSGNLLENKKTSSPYDHFWVGVSIFNCWRWRLENWYSENKNYK